MKTLYIVSAGIVFFLTTSVNSAEAQNSRHREYHKEERSHCHNDRKCKHHHKKYEKHHKHHHKYEGKQSKHRHYVSRDRQMWCKHGCNTVHCMHQSRHYNTYNYGSYHTNHSHQQNHTRQYIQRLPSRQYFTFYQGDEIYYHCQGYFYTYHPGRGYIGINLRLSSVNRVPNHCSSREVNGCIYAYSNGYYYIPHEHGYYRVSTLGREDLVCKQNY